ncbi:MAG: phosphatidate cytidylyltransferase, partial [bacterium]
LVHVLTLSVGASVFGQLGDLVESMWKRALGIKDSSAIIPGHGGVLDRFDSLLFAAPFVYFYLQAL